VRRASEAIAVDGRPDEAAWAAAAWSEPFVDIEGQQRPAPAHLTRFKMLWDERFLYVYAELESPHVWGTLTRRTRRSTTTMRSRSFSTRPATRERYYEFEVNALNTIWELTLTKPYRRGGKPTYGTNLPSLQSAVHVDGTVNDPAMSIESGAWRWPSQSMSCATSRCPRRCRSRQATRGE
jgi:hypothetical protein